MISVKSTVLLSVCLPLIIWSYSSAGSSISDFQAGRSYIHPSAGGKQLPSVPRAMGTEGGPTFHNGATLNCAHCHVMHASEQHGHDVADPNSGTPLEFVPARSLLRAGDPVALCLGCHDNVTGIPDVVGADVNGLGDRSAGHFALPGEANPRGHKLDYGLVTGDFELCMRCHFSGTFATASVTCIDCHNPHGNNRPRNLQWASYPGGEPQLGLLESEASSGLARFEASNVGYGTLNDVQLREVTNICIDCHHVLSGASYTNPDGSGIHSLHPSYDSERNSPNSVSQGVADGTTDPGHWEDGTGAGFIHASRVRYVNNGATDFASAQQIDATINGVFCLSCHKAHGSDNAFGLAWNPASGEFGDGCEQCHNRSVQ